MRKSYKVKNPIGHAVSSLKAYPSAVALGYDNTKDQAPLVLSLGKNKEASRMKSLARRYGIPIKRSKDMTKKLSNLEVNQEIPEELYSDIAKIFIEIKR